MFMVHWRHRTQTESRTERNERDRTVTEYRKEQKRTEANDIGTSNGNASEVDVLKAQVDFLTASLEKAETRSEELKADKQQLGERLAEAHKMLSAEQEKTRLLMLPAPKKSSSWWGYFRLKR